MGDSLFYFLDIPVFYYGDYDFDVMNNIYCYNVTFLKTIPEAEKYNGCDISVSNDGSIEILKDEQSLFKGYFTSFPSFKGEVIKRYYPNPDVPPQEG